MGRLRIDKLNREIGKRLLQIRKHNKLSQMEVSKRVGISFQQIQKYEQGVNQLSLVRIHYFARAFNMPDIKFFQYLMGTEDPVSDTLAIKLHQFSPKTQKALLSLATLFENEL